VAARIESLAAQVAAGKLQLELCFSQIEDGEVAHMGRYRTSGGGRSKRESLGKDLKRHARLGRGGRKRSFVGICPMPFALPRSTDCADHSCKDDLQR
jgi:hypothetical protein